MTFNDFVHKYELTNKATSNKKIYQVLSALHLSDVEIYLRDGSFSSDIGIVNLHPSKGTHWVCFIDETYFDSYGCSPPNKQSKFIIKRYGLCLYCEEEKQGLTNKRDSHCASYCLYIFYLTEVSRIDFKSAVLNLYYQMT